MFKGITGGTLRSMRVDKYIDRMFDSFTEGESFCNNYVFRSDRCLMRSEEMKKKILLQIEWEKRKQRYTWKRTVEITKKRQTMLSVLYLKFHTTTEKKDM